MVSLPCQAPHDPQFDSRLIQRNGARGILFFEEEFNPLAVQIVMRALAEILKKTPTESDLRVLLCEAAQKALADPKTSPETQKNIQGILLHSMII